MSERVLKMFHRDHSQSLDGIRGSRLVTIGTPVVIRVMMERVEEINRRRLGLYLQLTNFGDFIPMNIRIDLDRLGRELAPFESSWVPYNPRKKGMGRFGLSLTSLDGGMSGVPDLNSLFEYSQQTGKKVSECDFDRPTEAYRQVTAIQPIMDLYLPNLARTHFIRMNAGGHFPPHRDQSVSFQVPDYFRVWVPLLNCSRDTLFFIYDDKVMPYEPGRCYFFNSLKVHTVFSMVENAVILAMSIKLTQENVAKTVRAFQVQ